MPENKDPNAFTAADNPPTHEEALAAIHGATPTDDDTAGEDETHFHGKALSELDGLSDEQVLALDGFGPATLKQVKAARRKRDRSK